MYTSLTQHSYTHMLVGYYIHNIHDMCNIMYEVHNIHMLLIRLVL